MNASVTVDVAGGPLGGAARYRLELFRYLARTERKDVEVIGVQRRLDPSWLVQREVSASSQARRIALNNVSFVVPGGTRWTLLGNALHFLTDSEAAGLNPKLHKEVKRQATVVHLAARRSDVLVAPCTAMAERVARALPAMQQRITVRMHPVSSGTISKLPRENIILCPVIFESYKQMNERITDWVSAVEGKLDPSVRLFVTASPAETSPFLANNSRIVLIGHLSHGDLCHVWARSSAIFFPTGIESFGFPLAEARVNGQPVIARDTLQNREIAGPALYGFELGDADSLLRATEHALASEVTPDPDPFDPDAYFDWMLGPRP